jgi:hypothetical protein
MNRKKNDNGAEEPKKELKAANRASKVGLFSLTGVAAIPLIVIAFIWPNPVREREMVSLP